jgi:hypothetical protein
MSEDRCWVGKGVDKALRDMILELGPKPLVSANVERTSQSPAPGLTLQAVIGET